MKISYIFRIISTIALFSFIVIILTCTVDTVNSGYNELANFSYLQSLEVVPGTLVPEFSYNIENYIITHTSPISSASITATGYGLSDVITLDGTSQYNTCTKFYAFQTGANKINIEVDNNSTNLSRTYKINYTRPDVIIPVIAALNTVPNKEWHSVKPLIAVDVTDNFKLSRVKLFYGSSEIEQKIVDGTSDYVTFDLSSLGFVQGEDNTFTVTVYDNEDNSASDTIVVKWDDILPLVPTDGTYSLNPDGTTWDYEVAITEEGSNFTDATNITLNRDSGATVVKSFIYNVGTQKWDIVVANAKVTVITCAGPIVIWSLNTINATDNAGNVGSGSVPQSGGIGPDLNVGQSDNFQIINFE